MEGQDANAYVSSILDVFASINRWGIKIASVICDGNTAQKKAFNFEWEDSLRNQKDYPWLKEIIFIPCLCHRVSNAYKMTLLKNKEIESIIKKIREMADFLRANKKVIGKQCPSFISTRWVYDYDIVSFIIKNEELICQNLIPKEKWEPEIENISKILQIFKKLISIFEDPSTCFCKAFYFLSQGIKTLEDLSNDIPYSKKFSQKLKEYTLQSNDGGLWILAYLFTLQGHSDFYEKINKLQQTHDPQYLSQDPPRNYQPEDPLQTTTDEIISEEFEYFQNEEQIDEEEIADLEQQSANFTTHLDSAKGKLKEILKLYNYNDNSIKTMLRYFNNYIDEKEPFPNFRTADLIGFSWKQIGAQCPNYEPIARVAMVLLASGVSEASCERTISAQRLIATCRRRNASKLTLDARLRIMRAETKRPF